MRFLRLFRIGLVAVVSCGEADFVGGQPVGEQGSQDEQSATEPLDGLCIEDIADGEVVLVAHSRQDECVDPFEETQFAISKDAPQKFSIYGVSGIEYCVDIVRDSGYITISHPTGVVTRDDELFTWCVTPQTPDPELAPEYMVVRSLTPTAQFTVLLP